MKHWLWIASVCSVLFADITVATSIAPIASLTKSIGGDHIDVITMIPQDQSPHHYTPKPSQMKALDRAALYAAVGLRFETAWLPRFKTHNPRMQIVRLDRNITKLPIETTVFHPADTHDTHKEAAHQDDALDPHVWTSPRLMKRMAQTLAQSLIAYDPANADDYRANLAALIRRIDTLDKDIRRILDPLPPQAAFLTFHPSWCYFAHEYRLRQLTVESHGQPPSPRRMADILSLARTYRVRAIIADPLSSLKWPRRIASYLNVALVPISPLAYEWDVQLRRLATVIAKGET